MIRPARVLRLPSPAYSVAVLAVLLAVVALLDVSARPPAGAPPAGLGQPVDAESAIAFSDAWLTWRAVAAVAIVIFVFGLLSGIVLLPALGAEPGSAGKLTASGLLPRRSRDARGHGDHDVGGGRRTES